MFAGNAAYCLERRAPLFSDVQSITAAVVEILAPLDEFSLFHFIDKYNQSAGNHSEIRGERLLSNRRCRVEDPQDAGMAWSELQLA